MRKLCLIVLVFLLPLQASLAAVDVYHHQEPELAYPTESVMHINFGLHHDCDLADGTSARYELNDPENLLFCEGDHGHCHVHYLTILPSSIHFEFPSSALARKPEQHKAHQSHLFNHIERPKWA